MARAVAKKRASFPKFEQARDDLLAQLGDDWLAETERNSAKVYNRTNPEWSVYISESKTSLLLGLWYRGTFIEHACQPIEHVSAAFILAEVAVERAA
jgi:hypothetical protein